MNNLPIMDKMAVVFHGIIGGIADRNGVGEMIDVETCAKFFRHNVLFSYDCDIFLHSWSMEHEDLLISLYKPKKALFQPQEMFGYLGSKEDLSDRIRGQSFRTISRYTSFERAMELKKQHELESGFRYRWVLALRFDLVFFTKLNLELFESPYFYICFEPYWPNINVVDHLDDRIFLANSVKMDEYSMIAAEIRSGKYKDILHSTHHITYRKLKEMFNGDISMIRFGFRRYEDVEIYRFIMDPSQNPLGHPLGALKTKARMENLLKTLE